jgi:hypothetical protein
MVVIGNMLQLFLPPYGVYDDIWRKTYGTVYRFQGCFGVRRALYCPAALSHGLEYGSATASWCAILWHFNIS